jgi:ACS family glucarate transporter-like MFS transporter
MDVLHAGFATVAPSLFGFLGGISGGIISDYLIKCGWSLSWARKTPYIVGFRRCAGIIFPSRHSPAKNVAPGAH